MKRQPLLVATATAASIAVAYVAVLQIAFVADIIDVLWSGTVVHTSGGGWHGEVNGFKYDKRPLEPVGAQDYELAVTVDGSPEVNVILTEPIEYATVEVIDIRPTDSATGASGPLFTLRFGESHLFTLVVKPVKDGARPPRYKMEFDNSVEFDSLRVNDASGTDWSSVNLSPGPWFARFAAWDDSVKQFRRPSPVVSFNIPGPEPEPGPEGNPLVGVSSTGGHTIYLTFADSLSALTAGEVELWAGGVELFSASAPVAVDWNRFRQWRGENQIVAGIEHLAIVAGDSVQWVP